MNSAEAVIYFELKYCERCGGLWLRPRDAAAVYCAPCARQMAEAARRWRPPSPRAAALTALLVALLPPGMVLIAGCPA
jgi:hypothetical protein